MVFHCQHNANELEEKGNIALKSPQLVNMITTNP